MKKITLFLILILTVGLLAGCSDDDGISKHKLQVEVEGEGKVTPEVGTHNYEKNKEVTLEANAEEGWKFKEWKGSIESTEKETNVLMDGDKGVVAVFEKDGIVKNVSTKEEFEAAIDNSQVDSIKLEKDILLDAGAEITVDRLIDIDLNRKVLRANLNIETEAEGVLEIGLGIIDGDLTIDAPNSTIRNYAQVEGTTIINDVSPNSFINNSELNEVVIKDDNGAKFVNKDKINGVVDIQSTDCMKNIVLDGKLPQVKVTGEGAKVEIADSAVVSNLSVEANDVSVTNYNNQPVEEISQRVDENTDTISNGDLELNVSNNNTLNNTRITMNQSEQGVDQIMEDNNISEESEQLYNPENEQIVGDSVSISIEELSSENLSRLSATASASQFSNYIETTVDISNVVDDELSEQKIKNQYRLLAAVITDQGIGIKRVQINDVIANKTRAKAEVPVFYNGTRANELVISILEITENIDTPPANGFDYPIGNQGYNDDEVPVTYEESNAEWHNVSDFGNFLSIDNYDHTGGLHPGEDWNYGSGNDDAGKSIYAVAKGKVVAIDKVYDDENKAGWTVIVKHYLPNADAEAYEEIYSIYTHVTTANNTAGGVCETSDEFSISEGDIVERGAEIARVADDLEYFSPHLHFEMRTDYNEDNLYPNDNGNGYYSHNNQEVISMTEEEEQEALEKMQRDGLFDPSEFIDNHRPVVDNYDVGADFTYEITEGEFPKVVSFDGSASKSSQYIKDYKWLFGTGESAVITNEPMTNSLYGVAGEYTVVLEVTYINGEKDTISKKINLASQEENDSMNDIRVTLSWNRDVDMDLHVNAPNDSIDYVNTLGTDGGELDHDIIHPSSSEWNAPYRENITWEAGEAVQGTYKIGVNYFSARNESGPVEVRATVRVNEGTDNEIVKQYGPYVINEPDYNGDDSDAWWHVIKLDYPAGEFSEISDDSDINLNIEPTEQTKKKKKTK